MSARTRRALAYLGIGVLFAAVGGPAFIASYRHAIHVVELYGGASDQPLAGWLPLTTDGMLLLVLIVMGLRRLSGQPVGWLPWTAFIGGMVATVAANLAAAPIDPSRPLSGQTIGALAVALWPPITVMLTLELGAVTLDAIHRQIPLDPPLAKDQPTAPPAYGTAGPVDLGDEDETSAGSRSATAVPAAAPTPPATQPRTVPEPSPAPKPTVDDDVIAWAVDEIRAGRDGGRDSIRAQFGLSEWKARGAAAAAKRQAADEQPVPVGGS